MDKDEEGAYVKGEIEIGRLVSRGEGRMVDIKERRERFVVKEEVQRKVIIIRGGEDRNVHRRERYNSRRLKIAFVNI